MFQRPLGQCCSCHAAQARKGNTSENSLENLTPQTVNVHWILISYLKFQTKCLSLMHVNVASDSPSCGAWWCPRAEWPSCTPRRWSLPSSASWSGSGRGSVSTCTPSTAARSPEGPRRTCSSYKIHETVALIGMMFILFPFQRFASN